MTCRSGDLDDLLVASSLVASLFGGETTSHLGKRGYSVILRINSREYRLKLYRWLHVYSTSSFYCHRDFSKKLELK